MEHITSRKNAYIAHLRLLARDSAYRREQQEFVCDSPKLLEEALLFHAEITSVLWKAGRAEDPVPAHSALSALQPVKQYSAPEELFDYASPMANSPGPVFTVRLPRQDTETPVRKAIVLEHVQDPGNIGTVIRTAAAFGTGAVILTGECADLFSPKTVRSTMGALFRQRVLVLNREELKQFLQRNALKLYGAVLSDRAQSILQLDLTGGCAVAVGNEGNGLSPEFRELCDGELIIPMDPGSESLNAAVAASVILWEMRGR